MQTFQEKISMQLNVSPDKVWEVISAVGGVDKWFSSLISSCRVQDGKRYCVTSDGVPLEEDIIEVNHQTRSFKFAIPTQSMLPAEDIVESMSVTANSDGTTLVDWSGEFKAEPDNAPQVQQALRNIWEMGLKELEQFIKQNRV